MNNITIKQGEDHILNSGDVVQGKSSISITADIFGSNIPASNSTSDLKVGNAGDSETDNWQVVGYTIGSPVTSDNNTVQVTYNGNGDFSIKPLSGAQGMANFGTKFTFSLKAKNVTAETYYMMPIQKQMYNKMYQHTCEINKLNPLYDADFTQTFSEGQKLLPDTIKVYRVYQDAIDQSNRTGDPDINDIYNFDSTTGRSLNEDTAFEEFLPKRLYVTESGTDTPISYDDFVRKEHKAVQDAQAHHQAGRDNLAKQDMDSIPTINEIHFHVNGPFEYTDSNGITHDWSKNGGTDGENDNDTTKHDPHASFFIQMDTLLPTNMPTSWVITGDGPSSTVTTKTPHATVSSDGENGTTIYTGFTNGLNGWSNPEEETAKFYFADATDHKNVVDLDNVTLKDGSIVPNSLNGSNESGATIDTQIEFNTAQDVITQLENNGYIFVGVSNGEKISGNYDGSSRYLGRNYSDYLNNAGYGNYSFDTKKFTLNFIKTTKPYSTSKAVHEQTTYVYENGPKNNYVEDGNSTTQFSQDSEQSISITGTGTQYQDSSNQTVNTWIIDGNGKFTITVPATGHGVNSAYAPDYSRIIVQKIVPGNASVNLTVTDPDVTYVNDNNGNITITVKNNQNSLGEIVDNTKYSVIIPYYSKKVTAHYIDEDTIDSGTGKNKEFRAEDDYVGQPGTTTTNNSNTNITNYIFDKSASNGGTAVHSLTGFNSAIDNFESDGWTKPIQFDNSKLLSGKADVTYETDHYLYFYHATLTNHEYRSVKKHVSYYYENGPKQGQQVPSQFIPKDFELNFIRSQDVDLVTGNKGSWSNYLWQLETRRR